MSIKRTKIICSIGPATESEEVLTKLAKEGMNVVRLNFSHGNYEEYKERKELVELDQEIDVQLYHLERLSALLNSPTYYGIRMEFLEIGMKKD